MLLGVLSDTHGKLPDAVLHHLSGVDAVLHAGDVGNAAILAALEECAPVYAVRGNADYFSGAERLPARLVIPCGAVKIGLVHGHLFRGKPGMHALLRSSFEPDGVAAIVYGDTHARAEERSGGVLVFNPGSPVEPRDNKPPAMALFDVQGTEIQVRVVEL